VVIKRRGRRSERGGEDIVSEEGEDGDVGGVESQLSSHLAVAEIIEKEFIHEWYLAEQIA